MARMPDHPEPVTGAASYWADHKSVIMKEADGTSSIIDTKPNAESAAKCASMWQKRENAAVLREQKRQFKLEMALTRNS